ncbi:PleD family two-component system response regulator [Pseudaquidulcibacter saccharophilus]|uniref:PleD family two-component system response regulator n=1 Tax=Pseudaquidulcibacter saccharophilus TaxID=2831900 RepID=UPI001EFEF5BE|nr:PleD family two-component system response regulator [Pseudaquidulcibacter saccharophilus]
MTARVLIVDDVATNVRLLEAKLQHEYYTVISATSGEEAIMRAIEENPDVILLDVMMPGLDGFETCRRLKEDPKTHHIPVVMVTALDQKSDRIRGLSVGADDFLSKPIDDTLLLARVRSLAKYKSIADELRSREAVGRRIGVIDEMQQGENGLGARVIILEDDAKRGERLKRILNEEQRALLMEESNQLGPDGHSSVELLIVSASGKTFDGLRLAAHIRSQFNTRSLPILAIVDAEDRTRSIRALEIGVNDIINRPLDEDELKLRVRTLVRRKRYIENLRLSVDATMEKAVTDQLTGLHNRRYMETQLKALLERTKRGGAPVSVIIADIDHFKRVNDLFGHDAGDEVIRQFSERLASNFRPRDLACRFGGEEFVVIMPDTSAEDAYIIAERLRVAVSGDPFHIGSNKDPLEVTVSVGVAIGNRADDDTDVVIKRADQALYAAKQRGRNRVIANVA